METNTILKSIEPKGIINFYGQTGLGSDYKNEIDFSSADEQEYWFRENKFRFQFSNYRYIRKNSAIKIEKNVEELYNIDYCSFKNANFGNRYIYCFVNDVEYVNDKTSLVYIEVDAWQTFMFDITLLKSFISNQHENEFENNVVKPDNALMQNLNPESLEYGEEYVTVHTEFKKWTTLYALVCSSVSLTKNYGTKESPNLSTSEGGWIDNVPSALNYYLVAKDKITSLLSQLSVYPWISQCIQSITIIPIDVIGNDNVTEVTTPFGLKIYQIKSGFVSNNDYDFKIDDPLAKFGILGHDKLYTFPYSYIEMTGYNGSQCIIKPQYLQDHRLQIGAINFIGASPRLVYYPMDYLNYGDNGGQPDKTDTGDFLNTSLSFGDFPQFPVMVDNYILYQAQNANSFKLNNAIWNYNKKEATAFSKIDTGLGLANNLMSLNIMGGVNNLWSGYKQNYYGQKDNEINIRKQMAKVQDAEISKPSIQGLSGGDAFNISNGFAGLTLKWKTIHPRFRSQIRNYFTRYGYTSNKIEVPQIRGNFEFNYVKTVGCMLDGNIPTYYQDVIKQMFDNGVTFWHVINTQQDIGYYTVNERIT